MTNFHLSRWLRALGPKDEAAPEDASQSAEELALEKRAKELEKQKRKLEEEVGRGAKSEKPPAVWERICNPCRNPWCAT